MQYQIIFCLWLLTFESEIAAQINQYVRIYGSNKSLQILTLSFPLRQYDIIPTLVEIAKAAVKEKVIRVSIATLRVHIQRVI